VIVIEHVLRLREVDRDGLALRNQRAGLLTQRRSEMRDVGDVLLLHAGLDALDERHRELRTDISAEEPFLEPVDCGLRYGEIGSQRLLHLLDDLGVSHEKAALQF
jgi:hypothetical protein